MCSNYRPATRSDRLLTYFGVERARDEAPVDVWPLGLTPFIRVAEDGSGHRAVEDGIFGLLPHFAKELAAGRKTYNARSETVARLPSFRESWAKGWRCIIPVDAIYEPNWESRKAVRWIIQQPGEVPMGIAGIYRKWRHPNGREDFTFAMLTVNADGHPVMQHFHKLGKEKRMVVILTPQDYDAWLSCPLARSSSYLKQWLSPLNANPAPLPAQVPRSSSVQTSRIRPTATRELF